MPQLITDQEMVLARVKGVVAGHAGIPVEEVLNERELGHEGHDPLSFDSADRIQLAMLLEEEFKITIPDEDVDRPELGRIGSLAAYVQEKLAP